MATNDHVAVRREAQKQVRARGQLTLARNKCAGLQKALDTVDVDYETVEDAASAAADEQTLRRLELKFVQSQKHARKLLKGFASSLRRTESALSSLSDSMHDNLCRLRAADVLRNLGGFAPKRPSRGLAMPRDEARVRKPA